MRFLADMPISRSTVRHLKTAGHDAVHLLELGLEQSTDQDIAQLAVAERRVLLTMDMDFGAILAASRSAAPSVIVFRLRDNRPLTINNFLSHNLDEISGDLDAGAIAVFEESRVRVRRLPL